MEDFYHEIVDSVLDSLWEEEVQGNLPLTLRNLYFLEKFFDFNIQNIRSVQGKFRSPMSERIKRNSEEMLRYTQLSLHPFRGLLDTDVNLASLEESKRSIEQARKVSQLNRLAFVFLPVSLVTSFFGMNVTELNGNVRIWVFFVAAIVLTAFVSLVAWNPSNWITDKWQHTKARRRVRRAEARRSYELSRTGRDSKRIRSWARV